MVIQNLLGTVFVSDTRKVIIINWLHQQTMTIASKGGRENLCRCFHLIMRRTVFGSDVICKLCQVLQNALSFVFTRCTFSGNSFIRTCLGVTFTMRVQILAGLSKCGSNSSIVNQKLICSTPYFAKLFLRFFTSSYTRIAKTFDLTGYIARCDGVGLRINASSVNNLAMSEATEPNKEARGMNTLHRKRSLIIAHCILSFLKRHDRNRNCEYAPLQ